MTLAEYTKASAVAYEDFRAGKTTFTEYQKILDNLRAEYLRTTSGNPEQR